MAIQWISIDVKWRVNCFSISHTHTPLPRWAPLLSLYIYTTCEYLKWDVNYLSVRLMRHRSCCSNFNLSFGCCWFCVRTSLRLFPELVEIHRPWLMCWLARTICLAYDGSVDVTLVSLENIFSAFIYDLSPQTAFCCCCLSVFFRCRRNDTLFSGVNSKTYWNSWKQN